MTIKLNSNQLNNLIKESIMEVLQTTGLHPNTLRNTYKTMVDKQQYARAKSFANNLWERPAFIKYGVAAYIQPDENKVVLGFTEGDVFAEYNINMDAWEWLWEKDNTIGNILPSYTTIVYKGNQEQPIFVERSVGRLVAGLIKKINPDSKFTDWGMYIE